MIPPLVALALAALSEQQGRPVAMASRPPVSWAERRLVIGEHALELAEMADALADLAVRWGQEDTGAPSQVRKWISDGPKEIFAVVNEMRVGLPSPLERRADEDWEPGFFSDVLVDICGKVQYPDFDLGDLGYFSRSLRGIAPLARVLHEVAVKGSVRVLLDPEEFDHLEYILRIVEIETGREGDAHALFADAETETGEHDDEGGIVRFHLAMTRDLIERTLKILDDGTRGSKGRVPSKVRATLLEALWPTGTGLEGGS